MTVGLRMDTEHSAIMESVRRLEVFTGAGQRRTWRDEDKARIVAEIATSGDSVFSIDGASQITAAATIRGVEPRHRVAGGCWPVSDLGGRF
jgi:transposase-like protein